MNTRRQVAPSGQLQAEGEGEKSSSPGYRPKSGIFHSPHYKGHYPLINQLTVPLGYWMSSQSSECRTLGQKYREAE